MKHDICREVRVSVLVKELDDLRSNKCIIFWRTRPALQSEVQHWFAYNNLYIRIIYNSKCLVSRRKPHASCSGCWQHGCESCVHVSKCASCYKRNTTSTSCRRCPLQVQVRSLCLLMAGKTAPAQVTEVQDHLGQ